MLCQAANLQQGHKQSLTGLRSIPSPSIGPSAHPPAAFGLSALSHRPTDSRPYCGVLSESPSEHRISSAALTTCRQPACCIAGCQRRWQPRGRPLLASGPLQLPGSACSSNSRLRHAAGSALAAAAALFWLAALACKQQWRLRLAVVAAVPGLQGVWARVGRSETAGHGASGVAAAHGKLGRREGRGHAQPPRPCMLDAASLRPPAGCPRACAASLVCSSTRGMPMWRSTRACSCCSTAARTRVRRQPVPALDCPQQALVLSLA